MSDAGVHYEPGDTIIYTLHFTNAGRNDVTGVILSDTVPTYTTFNPAHSAEDWQQNGRTGTQPWYEYHIDSLRTGASGVLTIAFTLDTASITPPIVDVRAITNSVTIVDDGTQVADGNPTDNRATVNSPLGATTALQLHHFAATWREETIEVTWRTIKESNLSGFALYRSSDAIRDNAVRLTPALINAQGTSGATYHYNDEEVSAGVYHYWLQAVSENGNKSEYGPIRIIGPYRLFIPLISH